MLPHQHVIATTAVLPAAVALTGWRHSLAFWVAAVVVDVDHYIWFAGVSGSWRPNDALRFFRRYYRDPTGRHAAQVGTRHRRLLHGLAPWMLVWALSHWHPPLRPLAGGLAYHWLLDVLNGLLRASGDPLAEAG